MGRRTIGEPKPIRRMGPLTIESVDIEAQGIAVTRARWSLWLAP